ncbi:hypothetical protein, partial [Methanoculleus frigidifontis]|uniref:hypothetical protein n=1 Tax=Methanoculleus frigidifontis TaxID=2584085 RepID=UPI002658F2B8
SPRAAREAYSCRIMKLVNVLMEIRSIRDYKVLLRRGRFFEILIHGFQDVCAYSAINVRTTGGYLFFPAECPPRSIDPKNFEANNLFFFSFADT